MNETDLIRNLVRQAVESSADLPLPARADIYEAAALLLTGKEADEASVAASLLRKAMKAQQQFQLNFLQTLK